MGNSYRGGGASGSSDWSGYDQHQQQLQQQAEWQLQQQQMQSQGWTYEQQQQYMQQQYMQQQTPDSLTPTQQSLANVPPATPTEVGEFIAMHACEGHAISKLIALDPRFQKLVLNKGPMLDARDQTAVLIKRCVEVTSMTEGDWVCPGCMDIQFAKNPQCRKCGTPNPIYEEKRLSGEPVPRGRKPPPNLGPVENVMPATPEEVNNFLAMHNCEENGISYLLRLDPRLQRLVINKGSMMDARDQTAVLIKRCNEVTSLQENDWICPACNDIQFAKNPQCRKCGASNPVLAEKIATGEPLPPRPGSRVPLMEPAKHVMPATPSEVQQFIHMHSCEQHALAKLLSLDPKLQKVVINKGPMLDARDQTAVLIKRCVEVTTMKDGDWICPGCLDIQFAKNSQCRKCGTPNPVMEERVMRGEPPLPIRPGKKPPPNLNPVLNMPSATAEEVNHFLSSHDIAENGMSYLLSLDPRLQKVVINKGTMADARDPTAVLIKRCNEVTSLQDTDWICLGCYDIQFGKNLTCRKCGKANPHVEARLNAGECLIERSGRSAPFVAPVQHVLPATEDDISTFLAAHRCEQHAIDKLMSLDPRLQRLVINKGSMTDARDQTAVLIKRCVEVTQIKEGDWVCPSCNDIQFAKNMVCRKCGAPNPSMAGQAEHMQHMQHMQQMSQMHMQQMSQTLLGQFAYR